MTEHVLVPDEQQMLSHITAFPAQLEKAWTSNWTKDIPLPKTITNVLIGGMGGSGIAGQLAQDLFAAAETPIFTWADYGLPAWVDSKTLLILISHSGETEETLDGAKAAAEKKLVPVIITTGGKLAELAKEHDWPTLLFQSDAPPRASLGHLYGSLLTVLAKAGFPFKDNELFRAIEEVRVVITKQLLTVQAEELALGLANKLPLIAAAAPLEAVAKRWANQLNENSKTLALPVLVPELSHNLINGIEFPFAEKVSVLWLESQYSFSRTVARTKVLQKIVAEQEVVVTPLSVRASSQLAEQLLFLHLADLVSYYLAGVNGVDPTPIAEIAKLKEELAKI